MRKHQLPIALLKVLAEYVTFRQKCATHCNSLFRDVSFSLHFWFSARSTRNFFAAENNRARICYFFSMETTAIIHRRYMPRMVMLTH
jgi:hypothetical protein